MNAPSSIRVKFQSGVKAIARIMSMDTNKITANHISENLRQHK